MYKLVRTSAKSTQATQVNCYKLISSNKPASKPVCKKQNTLLTDIITSVAVISFFLILVVSMVLAMHNALIK